MSGSIKTSKVQSTTAPNINAELSYNPHTMTYYNITIQSADGKRLTPQGIIDAISDLFLYEFADNISYKEERSKLS